MSSKYASTTSLISTDTTSSTYSATKASPRDQPAPQKATAKKAKPEKEPRDKNPLGAVRFADLAGRNGLHSLLYFNERKSMMKTRVEKNARSPADSGLRAKDVAHDAG
ncbi:hypothetical protein LshimejAT787_0504290 [Lyophyllum shimeji]|uniref:Uncharacterized protein n=1 Tax=Lyophyllum shimeji TaxID=47721 RepID=A0A9P3PNA2_LYOSH|nr:hypothetical protein LshimejAT787_0504290 [Lyophyllum shimeji]